MEHVPKKKRLKWDKMVKELILIGYAENVKGYRVYNPATNNMTTSRYTVIMETLGDQNIKEILVECKSSEEGSLLEEESSVSGEENEDDETFVLDTEASSSMKTEMKKK